MRILFLVVGLISHGMQKLIYLPVMKQLILLLKLILHISIIKRVNCPLVAMLLKNGSMIRFGESI